MPKDKCAKLLNYQLAVTVFSVEDKKKINDVFSRINSSGRQLSNQDKRQAGVVTGFSDLVRKISSEVRGDDSSDDLELFKMPVISIDTKKESHGYKIIAEETFWCHHGILSTKQLRQSEDEDMIADISASILHLPSFFAKSKDKLDALYSSPKEAGIIETKLRVYGKDKLKHEIKFLIELIDKTIRKHSSKPTALRKTVMGQSTASSMKAPFYALFMAFYDLVIKESRYPENNAKILKALKDLHQSLRIQSRHTTSEERKNNIAKVKGLIQSHFVKKEPLQILHGPGLIMDFENSLRRSKIETPHYEFKQGLLQLDTSRAFGKALIKKLTQTACGIANLGPGKEGYIHIGVADRKEHADKIKKIDSITPKKVNGFYVVGVDREARLKEKTVEEYVDLFVSQFKKVDFSDHLKTSILKNIDTINYEGFSVIRLKIEPQIKVSYVENQCFIREHSHTKPVNGPHLEAIIARFSKTNKYTDHS